MPDPRPVPFEDIRSDPLYCPGAPFTLTLLEKLAIRAIATRDAEIQAQARSLAEERAQVIDRLRANYRLPADANIQVTDLAAGTAVWSSPEKTCAP